MSRQKFHEVIRRQYQDGFGLDADVARNAKTSARSCESEQRRPKLGKTPAKRVRLEQWDVRKLLSQQVWRGRSNGYRVGFITPKSGGPSRPPRSIFLNKTTRSLYRQKSR